MCRTPFETLTAPFTGKDLVVAGAEVVIAGARRLSGEDPSVSTVAARTVVELLAASFPIKQTSLENAVAELQEAPRSPGWIVSSPRSGTKHIGASGLVQLLGRCSSVQLELNRTRRDKPTQTGSAPTTTAEQSLDTPFSSYTLATRLSRRLRWLALKGAGAAGTAVFTGGIGAAVGISFGAMAAIPRRSLLRPLEFLLDIPDPGISFIMSGVWLAFSMLRHGAQRRDLLFRGVWVGGAVGIVTGAVGALAVVDPGDHGFQSVFLSGVRGRSLFNTIRLVRPQRRRGFRATERINIFAPVDVVEHAND